MPSRGGTISATGLAMEKRASLTSISGVCGAVPDCITGTAPWESIRGRIFDAARHGAELVERPAERHRAGAWHAAVGGPQPGYAAAHGRTHDAAASLAPDSETHQSRRRSSAGACARPRRAFLQQPWVHRLAAEPDVVQRERAHTQLGNQHRTCVVQTLHYRCILGRHAIAERLGAVRGKDARGVHEVLRTPRDAVQWPTVFASTDFPVGLPGLRERQFARERDDAAQFRIEALKTLKV